MFFHKNIMNAVYIWLAIFIGIFSTTFSSSANGASSTWNETEHTQVRLISALDTIGNDTNVTIGLHFKLNPEWKVYWRSAGDAGYPPSIDWTGSENLAEATMRWPIPERFSILGFETLGYKKEIVFPISIKLKNSNQDLSIKANVDYLACAELCIPYEARLEIFIPKGVSGVARTGGPEAHLISRYDSRVPKTADGSGMVIKSAEIKTDNKKGILIVTATATADFTEPDIFIEGPDGLSFSNPQTWIDASAKMAVLEISVDGLGHLKKPLNETELTFTLVDKNGPRGLEQNIVPTMASASTLAVSDLLAPALSGGTSIFVILGLALLGGIILNLMPCVLPVLSIKLMGAVSHGGSDKKTVRFSFIASAMGIIFSFLLLAGALVALKSAGAAIGWGIQFQHPWFLISMALVIVVFAANMWGFFEIHLPGAISEIGAIQSHQHGLGGHFLTGAFATLLATPCSAPFLGTAVGFALARGPLDIFMVFTALGIGLASPYLLIAMWPGLATKMPKPGRWMVILRRIMGFALAATALWLVSIIAVQVNVMAAWLLGAVLAVVVGVFWLHHRMGRRYGRLEWVALAVLAVLALLIPDGTRQNGYGKYDVSELNGIWQPFDQGAIPALVRSGKTVFVDVTAEWCLTCQINKAVSLSHGEALARLKGKDVVAMQADWTRPSDEISNYLANFGRYGIPFNAVYGPETPNGFALPELLSQQIVIDALNKAGKKEQLK
ncbi:MAG: protein-disulfide reductase DsbD family protein [Rhodospirillaceae bacterium]|nr:protein-disulfide reductase DsbD family protein [Rhodospirillaceae bacterium]